MSSYLIIDHTSLRHRAKRGGSNLKKGLLRRFAPRNKIRPYHLRRPSDSVSDGLILIIDGYNLINNWPRLIKAKRKSVESARAELFNLMQTYCDYTGVEGIIVYDGSQKERSVENANPKVIFSKKGESADTVIESLVYNLDDKSNVKVVTDDRALENLIVGMGASVISAEWLESEVRSASSSMRSFIEERTDKPTKFPLHFRGEG